MATPMNFQTLNFGDIPGQKRDANRRFYDSLGSIGGVVANTGTKVDEYLQRKQKQEQDKKQWDNMIAQQEYQKQKDRLAREYQETRDAINDERYDEEWLQKMEETNLANQQRTDNRAALEQYQKSVREAYTPEFLEKYGPTAKANYAAVMASKTYEDAVKNGAALGQGIYQQDMMDFQREQNTEAGRQKNIANVVNDVETTLSKAGIRGGYVPKKANDKRQFVVDNDAVQEQIAVIDEQLKKLDGLEYNNKDSNMLRSNLLSYRESLIRAMNGTPPSDYEILAAALKALDAR